MGSSDIVTLQWYRELHCNSEITQGDLIPQCPVLLQTPDLYAAIRDGGQESDTTLETETYDIVVLSQACDIVNDKIDSIVVCAVWPLRELMSSNDYYNSSDGRESLRQGKEPAYHLLDRYQSDEVTMEYSVVDFHRIYALPKDYIRDAAADAKARLRILPPYREHLSQAFARYFMRVGLPIDIDRGAIGDVKIDSM